MEQGETRTNSRVVDVNTYLLAGDTAEFKSVTRRFAVNPWLLTITSNAARRLPVKERSLSPSRRFTTCGCIYT